MTRRLLLNEGGVHVAGKLAVGVVLCCASPGCFLFGGGREPARLTSNDPSSKIPAIKKAVNARDTQTADQLVKALQSDDPAVRFYAIRGLENLTGETFGYVWYADERQRRDPLEKWRHWLDGNNGTNGTLAGVGDQTTTK
jgi:hypothetical protein